LRAQLRRRLETTASWVPALGRFSNLEKGMANLWIHCQVWRQSLRRSELHKCRD
jgi:hypothetical protein